MSMPYKGSCEHLKEGYCIPCISKIKNNWTTCMNLIGQENDDLIYINSWDKDYPRWIRVKIKYE